MLSTILFRRRMVPVFSPSAEQLLQVQVLAAFVFVILRRINDINIRQSMAAFSFSSSFCFSSSAFFRARSTADGISPSFPAPGLMSQSAA